MSFHINNFLISHFYAYWGIRYFFLLVQKTKETHRSWLAGRGWQVMVAELTGFRIVFFSQCVNYIRFNEKWFCFRWQENRRTRANPNTKTSNLVLLYDLRYLMGHISSMMTKHIVVQRRLHRFAYLIIRIILFYYLWFTHAILPLYFSPMSLAPELNTGNIAQAETTSEAYTGHMIQNKPSHWLKSTIEPWPWWNP